MKNNGLVKDIIVIGGGASGMMAAIQAAKLGADVMILERNNKLGKKILATGNGKCNFTHEEINQSDYYGSFAEYIDSFMNNFNEKDMLQFLSEYGMLWKNKNGYLYPYSEQASTMSDFLIELIQLYHVNYLLETKVVDIKKEKKGSDFIFYICCENQTVYYARSIILSVGGKASPQTGSDGNLNAKIKAMGIPMTPLFPALTGIKCKENYGKIVSGVRSEGGISVKLGSQTILSEYGEIQFTDYGISGIPVFQISGSIAKALHNKNKITIEIDLLKQYTEKDIVLFFKNKHQINPKASYSQLMTGFLNRKLSNLILNHLSIKGSDIPNQNWEDRLKEIAYLCKHLVYTPVAINDFDKAQVTAGGVPYYAVTDKLEAKNMAGIYLAGELLDVDGKCGGYNLQWAWTSGYIAGSSAAKGLGYDKSKSN